MDVGDLAPNSYFTTNGKDIWKLGEYCTQPTCTLVKLCPPGVTDKAVRRENFGMGGITAQRFHKITMPIEAKESENE